MSRDEILAKIKEIDKLNNWKPDWQDRYQSKYYIVYKKLSDAEVLEVWITYTGRAENTYMSKQAVEWLVDFSDKNMESVKKFLFIDD